VTTAPSNNRSPPTSITRPNIRKRCRRYALPPQSKIGAFSTRSCQPNLHGMLSLPPKSPRSKDEGIIAAGVGSPIQGSGGLAAGREPLMPLLTELENLLLPDATTISRLRCSRPQAQVPDRRGLARAIGYPKAPWSLRLAVALTFRAVRVRSDNAPASWSAVALHRFGPDLSSCVPTLCNGKRSATQFYP
jgi:hypothetical protein